MVSVEKQQSNTARMEQANHFLFMSNWILQACSETFWQHGARLAGTACLKQSDMK